jgi:hypothetical protein
MKHFDFGGGVIVQHPTEAEQNRSMDSMDSINPQQIIETIKVAVTVIDAAKILWASLKDFWRNL